MSRVDTPFDPGADSCTKRTAQLLGILGLLVVLVVQTVRSGQAQSVRAVIGELVKIRYARGLTQQQVADRMGQDRSNVGHWEQGRYDLRLSSVLGYCRAVGVRLAVIPVEPLEGGDRS